MMSQQFGTFLTYGLHKVWLDFVDSVQMLCIELIQSRFFICNVYYFMSCYSWNN